MADETRKQKLKAYIYHGVAKICEEEAAKRHTRVEKETVAVLTNLVYEYAEIHAVDLEMFAEHGRRATINVDDVLLCARKNDDVADVLRAFINESGIAAHNAAKAEKRKRKADKGEPETADDGTEQTETTTTTTTTTTGKKKASGKKQAESK